MIIKDLMTLCYKNNISFDKASDNHKCIYRSNRLDSNKPMKNDKIYFTFDKVNINKKTTAYY